jgi:hypothetical protein
VSELLAICCFGWAAATGPVTGYFVFTNGVPTTFVEGQERACIGVSYGDSVEVQAYDFSTRRVGPFSEPWTGQHWGRCVDYEPMEDATP